MTESLRLLFAGDVCCCAVAIDVRGDDAVVLTADFGVLTAYAAPVGFDEESVKSSVLGADSSKVLLEDGERA